MPINRSNFSDVSESDIQELIVSGVAEGLQIEYKQSLYGGSDADKKELLKDVSAFANVNGGHIVIGMKEEKGIAVELVGVSPIDVDAEILRLEQIIRSGVEPRIPICNTKSIPLSTGGLAIIIRVGRSWLKPHRVSSQNSNKFWIRNSAGSHEASMDELRSLFTQNELASDKAKIFRNSRVNEIETNDSSRPLVGGGRLILHIAPYSGLLGSTPIDLAQVMSHSRLFMPIGSMGFTSRYNFEGMINERGGESNYGYTQIFRNGALEATKAQIINIGDNRIYGAALERDLFKHLGDYIDGLRNIGVEPPLVVMITLEGVRGSYYVVSNEHMFGLLDLIKIDRDCLFLPECFINDYGDINSYHIAVKPAIDALWNAVGLPGCSFFDESGKWLGPKQGR